MSDVTVFMCKRGKRVDMKKIQLELRPDVLEKIKDHAKEFQGGKYTPKQIMENLITNFVDGVQAG